MTKPIITILCETFVEMASIARKRADEDITEDQMGNLARDLAHNTAAEISRRVREDFVTDN